MGGDVLFRFLVSFAVSTKVNVLLVSIAGFHSASRWVFARTQLAWVFEERTPLPHLCLTF